MKKILTYIAVVIALATAVFATFSFNPDNLLRRGQKTMGLEDIKEKIAVTGHPAGEDIPRISSVEEFAELSFGTDYVTLQPLSIVPTGVWHLKPWVSSYFQTRHKGKTIGTPKRKPELITSKWNIHMDYNQYYLLELTDGAYILAEIPKPDADAIKRGKTVTLPIGEKRTFRMPEELSEVCEEKGAYTEGIFFAFDEEWYKSIDVFMVLLRLGVGVAVFFAVGVCLIMLIDKAAAKIIAAVLISFFMGGCGMANGKIS